MLKSLNGSNVLPYCLYVEESGMQAFPVVKASDFNATGGRFNSRWH